ncbi:MAG: rhodanese-like domain-containing protein [Candidatus Acidiferrum sp.]
MFFCLKFRGAAALLLLIVSTALPLALACPSNRPGTASRESSSEPWTDAQVLQAADLVQELRTANGAHAPTIVYVGFRTLFEGGHIPGSTFHGTASTEKGLLELKKWAAALPHDTNLVIYCGCCPFDHCPNIRPAYTALHEMGFTHLRVLVLPKSFAADWVEKGYPIQKGL